MLLDGTQTADAGVELDEALSELLELAELGDLAFGLTDGGGGRQRLTDGVAIAFEGEPGVGAVARLAGLMAAAVGFATTARGEGNRTGAQVAELAELVEDFGALFLELIEGIGHWVVPCVLAYNIRKEIRYKKKTTRQCPLLCRTPLPPSRLLKFPAFWYR